MAIITYGSGEQYGTGRTYGEEAGTAVVSISSSLSASSTFSGQLKVSKKFSASLSCSASISGTIKEAEFVSGSISTSSNIDSHLSINTPCIGTLSTTSNVSGIIKYIKGISSSLTTVSVFSNSPLKPTIGLIGSAPFETSIVGTSTTHWNLTTYSLMRYGRARIFGSGITFGEHQSVFVILTVVSANINRHFQLEGTLNSTTSASLISETLLDGVIENVSNLSGKIVGLVSLIPMYLMHVNSGTDIGGNLGGIRSIQGGYNAHSNISGVVSNFRKASGTISISSLIEAKLIKLKLLSAQISSIVSILGTVKASKNLGGVESSELAVSGDMVIDWTLTGDISEFSIVTSGLKVLKSLASAADALSSFVARLLSFSFAQGEIVAISRVSGLMIPLKDSAGKIGAQSALSVTSSVHWNMIPKSQVQYGRRILFRNGWKYGQRVAILAQLYLDPEVKASYIFSGAIDATSFLIMHPSPRILGEMDATSVIEASLTCFKKLDSYIWAFSLIEGEMKKVRLCFSEMHIQSSVSGFLKALKRFNGSINMISIIAETPLLRLHLLDGDIHALSQVLALMLRLKLMLGSIISAQSIFGLVERIEPILAEASCSQLVANLLISCFDWDISKKEDLDSLTSSMQIDSTLSKFDLDVDIETLE